MVVKKFNRFPIWIQFFLVTSLFLLTIKIRMKCIEQDYTFNNLNVKINRQRQIYKELRAEKAYLLSNAYLSQLADQFNLGPPNEKQVIFIPD